jgi:dTDP-4-dehydrorhamnose reductase
VSEFLVTGAGGALGSVLMRVHAEQRRSSVGLVSPSGPTPHLGHVGELGRAGNVHALELRDAQALQQRVLSTAPKVIVHLAAVTQIAAAYEDPEHAREINVECTARLTSLARACGARLVFASTDLVFDGEHAPYGEDAATEPRSIYGRTKLEAECYVLTYERALVVRLPLLYGVPDVERAPTFFQAMTSALRAGREVKLFEDELRTPLWLDDAARALVRLADSELTGVIHAGGPERLSRHAMGVALARALGADPALCVRARTTDLELPEPRARDVSLDSSRFHACFGVAPGRTFAEAVQRIVAGGGSSLLS